MTRDPANSYDFHFSWDNVYGHSIDLLRRRKAEPRPDEIHLDIGCGFGRIAEYVKSELGRHYVGLDFSGDGLASLAGRGFEAHEVRLESREQTLSALNKIIKGRTVGSITLLDAIEHFPDGDEILAAVGDIARQNLSLVVVSVPNVTHRDIGAKLAFGNWAYTATGLLDRTHLRLFDQKLLTATLEKAGLLPVDSHDIVQVVSDQHFPSSHPALSICTPLGGLLFDLASCANPWANTYQFVWLCAASRELPRQTFVTEREEHRPFLSVVTRTQGKRLHTLMEALTCLSGQTDTDFEVVVVGHKLSVEKLEAVKGVIADTQDWLRSRVKLVLADEGGRSRPLNIGFAAAGGRYIAILDDDDIPLAHWVEEFRKLDARAPGCVLRCTSVRQNVANVTSNGRIGLRAEGPPERIYPSDFDFLAHLVDNKSPNNTIAFPRGAFHDLGLRFDESLDTTEDWDFLQRAMVYCGVVSSAEITGIYRWWINHECSSTLHSLDEWRSNYEAILRKQDQNYLILPKGETAKLRKLVQEHAEMSAALAEQRRTEQTNVPPTSSTLPDKLGDGAPIQEGALDQAEAASILPPDHIERLDSVERAVLCGRALKAGLPRDLTRTLRKGLRQKIFGLKLKALMAFYNKKKRRHYRQLRRIYRQILREIS